MRKDAPVSVRISFYDLLNRRGIRSNRYKIRQMVILSYCETNGECIMHKGVFIASTDRHLTVARALAVIDSW